MSAKAVDYELEEYYINFKQSMLNFYQKHSFSRPIEQWSERLNHLQKKQQYHKIQKLIVKIISLYAIDLMRTCDTYNAGILETNIKRFNRVCKEIDSMEGFSMELINYNDNIVFLLFE